jgi:ditrans,polycis-polyprenyl diphosphate synthase
MVLSVFSSAYEYIEDSLRQATISILKQGPIPRHLGFVLDGNRRYARAHGASSTRFGHYEGFRQLEKVISCPGDNPTHKIFPLTYGFLMQVLEICMQLGVEAVTVYAFSIENFKRSKEEVDYLMQLFREAFSELCEKK